VCVYIFLYVDPRTISGGGCFGYLYIIIIISCYTLITIIQLYHILRYKNPNAAPPPTAPPPANNSGPGDGGGEAFLWRRRRAPLSQVVEAVAAAAAPSSSSSTVYPTTRVVRSVCSPAFVRRLHRRRHWPCWSPTDCILTRVRSFESKCARRCHDNIFLLKRKNCNNE